MYVLIIEIYLFGLCCGFGGAGLFDTDVRPWSVDLLLPPWSDSIIIVLLPSEFSLPFFGSLILISLRYALMSEMPIGV